MRLHEIRVTLVTFAISRQFPNGKYPEQRARQHSNLDKKEISKDRQIEFETFCNKI